MQLLKVNLRSLSVICFLIVSISLLNVVKGDDVVDSEKVVDQVIKGDEVVNSEKKVTRSIWDIPFPRPAEMMEDGSVAMVLPAELINEEIPIEDTEEAKADEAPMKKKLILGFIQFDEIKSLGFAPHLEKIFPKNWVLPKFDAQNNKLIADAQQWIGKAKEVFGFQNFKKLLGVLESKGKSILNPANLPIMIKEMIMPLLEKKEKPEASSETMLQFLPNLDQMNFTTLSSIFNIPTELEWPVPLKSLDLLIPVVVPLPEDSLLGKMQNHTLHLDALNVNLPVTDMNGDVLFANIKNVFQGLNLPEKLNIKPIATFSELQDEKIIPFWDMLKGPLLSKMTILGTEKSNVIMGPVMNLISLPKIILSNVEQAVQSIDIPEAIKKTAKKLKSSFKSFNQLTEISNEENQEEIGDEVVQEFLNFSIPFVGVQKNTLSTLLAPLEGDQSPMEDDSENLITEIPAIVAASSKIELLATELKKSLESLRTLIPTTGTNLSHNHSVQLIISFSSTLIKVIDDMLASLKKTALDKALFPESTELKNFLNLFPKLNATQPLKGRRLARSLLNPGFFFSPQRSSPVIPVPLEQFRTLLSLTQNIARSPLTGDAIQTTFPEMLHLPLSYAHITNRLPQELLSQPLSSVIADTSNIPQTMLNMNLGSFLDMANGLNNWVSSGNPSIDTPVSSRNANEFPRILNLPDFSQALGAAANGISLV